MSFITLEQHFYGSAPIGLSSSRGYQTVAKSAGCTRHELVEKHCSFFRPNAKNELRPVNWGWLRLADDRVCIHRIAYSGNDELGRPGNFLAHNLIARPDELDAIDYDIPSLLRWVIDKSPVRYPLADGPGDGFCRRHDQIYEMLRWNPKRPQETPSSERSKLATIDSLKVPIADLLALRSDADAALGGILGDRALVDLLLRGLLADVAQRKPVLLLGASDGNDQSALERRLIEILFTLLPYHCRKRLTFATYCGLAAGSSATALPDRRLLMTTRHNPEFRITGAAESFPAWIVNGSGGPHKLPNETSTAKLITRTLGGGRLEDLRKLREAASAFDFAEETKGIALAVDLPVLKQAASPEQFLLFHKVARSIRPGQTGLLKTAHRLVSAWIELPNAGRNIDDLKNTAEAYVVAIDRLLPAPEEEPRIVDTLSMLFLAAFENQAWSILTTIAKALGSGEKLKPLWKPLLDRCYEQLAKREAAYPILNEMTRWWSLCKALEVESAETVHVRPELLRRNAVCVGRQFLALPRSVRPHLKYALSDFVVPILRRLAPADAEELWSRLAFIRDISPGDDRAIELYLTELWKTQNPSPRFLEHVVRERHDLLLRYYSAWRALSHADPEAHDILEPAFESPEVVMAIWTLPSEQLDGPLLRSALVLLKDWALPERSDARRTLAMNVIVNPTVILARFERDDSIVDPNLLAELGKLQVVFIRLLMNAIENPRSKEDKLNVESVQSIASRCLPRVIAFLLTRPLTVNPEFAAVLEEPVKCLRMWHTDPERLAEVANSVADRCQAMNPARGGREWPLIAEWRAELAKKHDGKHAPRPLLDVEIDWLTMILESVPAANSGKGRANIPLLVAKMLYQHPELVQKPRNEFEKYFKDLRTEDAVWRLLAEQLARDLSSGRLEYWLKENSACEPLLEMLRERQLLADVGEQAAARLQAENFGDNLKRLDRLAGSSWKEISEPGSKALIQRKVSEAIESFRSPPSPNSPARDRSRILLEVCTDVCASRDQLTPPIKWRFWTSLAEAFAGMQFEAIVGWFPWIREVGLALPSADLPAQAVWLKLFQPIAEQRNGEKVRQAMVGIADSLFRPRKPGESWLDDPCRAARDFEPFFQLSRDALLKEYFEGVDAAKSGTTTDLFLPTAALVPPLAYAIEEMAQPILVGRARLLAHRYADYPETVLSWIAHWAGSNNPKAPEQDRDVYLGRALCGFLTAAEKTEEYITRQANLLIREENWSALSPSCDHLLEEALRETKSLLKEFGHERAAARGLKLLEKKIAPR